MKISRRMAAGILATTGFLSMTAMGTAMAEEVSNNNYLKGRLGIYEPTGGLDDADFDTGASLGFVYGRYLTDWLILEGSFDPFGAERKVSGSNGLAGNYTSEETAGAGAWSATLKGVYTLGPVDLFLGGGAGLYSVFYVAEVDSQTLGTFTKDETDVVFGVHGVVGADYNITERFFVGVEGLYRWTGDVDIEETVAGIPISYDGDLNGYAISISAGWRF